MKKKSLSTKIDPDFAERFEKAARERGIKKSEALRRAAKEWMEDGREKEGDPWTHIPESMNADIKKIFEAIRDYQHLQKEHPLNFALRAKKVRHRDNVKIPDLKELLSVKWSSKTHTHKGKLKKAFALELLEAEFNEDVGQSIFIEGEIKLTDLGKMLMKSIDGGNYDPREIHELEEIDIETCGGNGGEHVERQQKLIVKNRYAGGR